MIHVCEHEDGCYLMAENMQRRKDELFLNIQNVGQLSLFDFDPTVSKTAEGEMVTKDEIKDKIRAFLKNAKGDLRIKKFIAGFCNEYGLLCDFKMMHEILEQMDTAGELEIVRNPATNSRGKSRFWDEKNGQTVTIRRLTK